MTAPADPSPSPRTPTPPGTPTVPVARSAGSGAGRGMPLALRLALILSGVTLITLLVAGAVVNRVVSRSYEDVVTAQQDEQVNAAAAALGDDPRRAGTGAGAGARIMNRLSQSLGGPVSCSGPKGRARALRPPATAGRPGRSAPGHHRRRCTWTRSWSPPSWPRSRSSPTDRPFLHLFNGVLLVGGLAAVAVIAGVSVLIARRQTKPLDDVPQRPRGWRRET